MLIGLHIRRNYFSELLQRPTMVIHFPTNPTCNLYIIVVESIVFKVDHLNPGSSIYYLCDLGKVIDPVPHFSYL